MLAPGSYARTGVRHPLAIDVGTSTIRIWTPKAGTVVDEPAVVALGPAGSPRAVGHAAVALGGRRDVELVRPVHGGVIADVDACGYLLRVLIGLTGRPPYDRSPVLVGVPATATLGERNLLTAVLRRVVDGQVTAVEEPLAAALACRPELGGDQDVVAVDIGHGRTEVVRIADRAVTAAERVGRAAPDGLAPGIAAAVRRMTTRRPDIRRRRLLITGGGAAHTGLAGELAALTGRTVTVPANASQATLAGLRLLLTG